MVEKYLRPINMEHLAKPFTENRINGAVLMALEVRARRWEGRRGRRGEPICTSYQFGRCPHVCGVAGVKVASGSLLEESLAVDIVPSCQALPW